MQESEKSARQNQFGSAPVRLAFGSIFAFSTALILRKMYHYAWPICLISAILVFAAVVFADMLGVHRIGTFAALVLDVFLGIIQAIRWLIQWISKRS